MFSILIGRMVAAEISDVVFDSVASSSGTEPYEDAGQQKPH
jgi:hypothetical protein